MTALGALRQFAVAYWNNAFKIYMVFILAVFFLKMYLIKMLFLGICKYWKQPVQKAKYIYVGLFWRKM